MDLSELLQHSTIRIKTILSDKNESTGTGFFFNFLQTKKDGKGFPVIITNKHVVKDSETGILKITLKNEEGKPDYSKIKEYTFSDFEKRWINHPDPNIDLCALPIGNILNEENEKGIKLYFNALNKDFIMSEKETNELLAMEDITMIGYPNGIWDSVNNLPIFRKGITATNPKKDYNGKEEFMIDAACFPGSSGSPVFLLNEGSFNSNEGLVMGNRLKLLGVLYAGPQHTAEGKIQIVNIPTRQEAVSISRIPNNLGIVIKAKKILELEEEFKKRLEQKK